MRAAYKNLRGRHEVRRWCTSVLAEAGFPLAATRIDTSAGYIHLTSAGSGASRIVLIPGTGFNAAAALPWLRALSSRWPTTVIDLPGQPGLSDPCRPRRAHPGWYGRVVDEVLAIEDLENVVLVGNSLGAAVALAAHSPRIAARALISPAGFIRLSVDPKLLLASTRWLLRPSADQTRDMLRLFVAPGEEPPEIDVEWMTVMAAGCRTTFAPPPLPADLLATRADLPCVVAVGEYDRFLPPRRLAPAVRTTMSADLRILPGMGHLTTPAHLDEIVSLVAEVADPPRS